MSILRYLLRREFKWALITFLDRRRDTCWAELVPWALWYPWRDLRDVLDTNFGSSGGKCQRDALRDGSCYCCKFAADDFAEVVSGELVPQFLVNTSNVEPAVTIWFNGGCK